jgi:hypothetical protein
MNDNIKVDLMAVNIKIMLPWNMILYTNVDDRIILK